MRDERRVDPSSLARMGGSGTVRECRTEAVGGVLGTWTGIATPPLPGVWGVGDLVPGSCSGGWAPGLPPATVDAPLRAAAAFAVDETLSPMR